jgi:hypothetical protein
MAKKPDLPRPSGEMNFIMFSLRGGDDTLQQSFRTISQALENAFQRKGVTARPLQNAAAALPDASEIESEVIDSDLDSEGTDNGDTEKPKTPRQTRKAIYKTVGSLNLRPEGKQSLREFFKAKKPESQQEQFVVILFYLTKQLNLTGVGPDHINTAFLDVGKPVPNIRSAAQNIARRRGWIEAKDINDLKVTSPGENFVNHDLPRTGSAENSSDEEE